MYRPKIREALIPRIDRAAREAGVPMTRWVNHALETALADPRPTDGEEPVAIGNKEINRSNQPTTQGGQCP